MNDEEKGHQVQLMRFIYEQAQIVHIWLGCEEQGSEGAMKFLLHIQENKPDDDWIFQGLYDNSAKSTLDGVTALFRRPYWKRVWIIQELVCAKNAVVHCGNLSIRWSTVLRLQRLLAKWAQESNCPTPANPRTQMRFEFSNAVIFVNKIQMFRGQAEAWRAKDKTTTLFGLLCGMDGYQATHPKDRIYALLGLVEDMNLQQGGFPIDYTLTDEQVYIDVAKYIIVTLESLNILTLLRPEQAQKTRFKLPSWCPDWTLDFQTNMLLSVASKNAYSAASDTNAKVSFRPDENVMVVTGIVIDTIKTLAGPFEWDKIY
jgi:hypothetical protein